MPRFKISDGLLGKINTSEIILYDIDVLFKHPIFEEQAKRRATVDMLVDSLCDLYLKDNSVLDVLTNSFDVITKCDYDLVLTPFIEDIFNNDDLRQVVVNNKFDKVDVQDIVNKMSSNDLYFGRYIQFEYVKDMIRSFYSQVKVPQNILYFSKDQDNIEVSNSMCVSTVYVRNELNNNYCKSTYTVETMND